jgi:hypothetical protein
MSRAIVLVDNKPEGASAVIDVECADAVALEAELFAGLEFIEIDLERQAPDRAGELVHHAFEPGRPVDRDWDFTPPKRKSLQHSRDSEYVIGVKVRDEDVFEVAQADGFDQLALRSFAAVEQQLIASAPHQH